MPSRKYHTKTRHGCDTCKQGKVRCDLEKPICNRCQRLERPCSFADEETGSFKPAVPMRRNRQSTTVAVQQGMSSSVMQDLELMHHFSTLTCYTMTDIADTMTLWQYDIPKLAFKHEFLLHGLLALSALHLAQTELEKPAVSLRDVARGHQSAALSSYIPLLRDINQENSHALFAFSAVLGATSFALLQEPDELPSTSDFIRSFIDVFELLVGSTVIAAEGRTWLRAGHLSSLLVQDPFRAGEADEHNPEARMSLDAVLHAPPHEESPSNSLGEGDEGWVSYVTSAEQLARLFPPTGAGMVSMSRLVGWPALAGSRLILKLKHFDPVALILLAHYGAAMHLNEHIWYMKGLGRKLVTAIVEIVEEEWHPYLSWPTRMVTI